MKRFLLFLSLLLSPLLLLSKGFSDALVEQALAKYHMLERFNNANDARSQQHKNEFVIELDPDWVLDPNWIEERPDKQILSSQYEGLSTYLRKFNNDRTDGLRFYVVVVNNYYAEIKETIEVITLPEEITNLSQLVRFPDKKEQLERFKKEVESIPAQISNALAKTYSDRVVYFYGKIKLYNHSGPKEYKHDNLAILGDQIGPLKEAIKARAKANLISGDSEGYTIEKIVFNIANSIQIVYDGEGPGTSLFACSQSLDELVTSTQSIYEKEYANEVKSITQILDNPSSDQQHKGSRYVLGGSSGDFIEDDLFNYDILLDKITLLNAGASNLKLYVVFKEVGFAMPTGDWEKMAKDVYQASSIAKQAENLIMIVPYLPVQCTEKGFLGIETSVGVGMLMPAVYGADAHEGLRKEMNSVLSIRKNTWAVNFNHAFTKIPKSHTAYRFKLLYNNELMFLGVERKENTTGYADIHEVELWEDARAYKLSESSSDYSSCTAGTANGTIGASYVDYEAQHNCLEAYANRNEAILAMAPDWKRVTETNLRQLALTEAKAKTFAKWYAQHKRYGVVASLDAPDDEYFYGGRNPVKVEDMLLLIDAGSTVASVVGADALFDGIGAYYAYENGKYVEAGFYAAAVAIPLMNGATRRMIMDGGAYTLKTLKGSYVTVPKGVLGMNYVAKIEQGFSQFSRQALNMKSFSKAAQYKTDVKFVTALEEGLLADGDAIKKLNDNPDLVEEFYQFHKAEKGDLAKFLNSRWYDFLPEGLKIDITNTPALKTAFENASPEVREGMIDAWKKLSSAGDEISGTLRREPEWLKQIDEWDKNGVSIVPDPSNKKLKVFSSNGGGKVAEITPDGKLLPEEYDYPPSAAGTPVGEVKNGYQIYKIGDGVSVRRVADVSEYDLNDLAKLKASVYTHILERHGPDVPTEALRKRATTGLAPDGSRTTKTKNGIAEAYIPPKSSKFNDATGVKKALTEVGPGSTKYNSSKLAAEASGQNSFMVEHDFGTAIGQGYTVPGKSGMNHPISNLPLIDEPVPTPPLTKVKAFYVRDSATGPWYILTMYPD